MDEREILAEAEDRMKKVIEGFKKTLATTRAGRATPVLLEKVVVDYYGMPTPINQVASIGVTPPRTLVVQPWDKKMLGPLEKAIQKADLGAMPINDGNILRLTLPQLTGERRQELLKSMRKECESQRVALRNVRRDVNEEIKKGEKNKSLSEDESKRIQDKVQKLTDKYVKVVDDLASVKEKEIMEV